MTKSGYATVLVTETTYTKICELAEQLKKSKSAIVTELVNGMTPSTESKILPPQNEPEIEKRAGWDVN